MPKQIIIAEQHQIAAVFWEDQIQELVVSTGTQQVSDIYLGLVENIIPGIDAAFVNIGDAEKNGFIHVTDLGPLRLRKTAGAITELLTPQQKVLVQVMKEPTGNKGPRLTGNISLPGRYLVLIPSGKGVNLSRRIRSEEERNRLRALAILTKPPGMGLLIRTEAEGKTEEAIIEDLEFLQKQWETVQQQAVSTRAPALLNRDDDFIQLVLRDMFSADVNRIVTDSASGMKRVKQHLMSWGQGRVPAGVLIDQHRESQSILDYFRVNAAIREALKPRVDLPSGGYIIIEPTEALTVVDVNSGSFTRSATSRETVLWTNSEAATEIARQLRLRNIGGVIIIDFIDMDSRRDQLKLLEHFSRCIKADKARPQIAQLSELGLVELTRKRQGQNIYELFGKPCPTCGGLGHLVELPGETTSVSLDVTTFSPPSFSPSPKSVERRIIDLPEPVVDPVVNYESSETSSDFDLSYHPNYQEQGAKGSNRRRRRRPGPETPLKEDTPHKVLPNLPDLNKVVGAEEEVEEPSQKIPEERPERREKIIHRADIPPAERVSVEMTPLEQDVYALMGVSPLVRLDREFKDPKSVIVTVRSPGEPEVIPEIAEKTAPSLRKEMPMSSNDFSDLAETNGKEDEKEWMTAIAEDSKNSNHFTNYTNPDQEIESAPEVLFETNAQEFEPIQEIEDKQEDPEQPVIRRRRRRSSAQEG
jgi:ribonuclease E